MTVCLTEREEVVRVCLTEGEEDEEMSEDV